MSPSGTDGLGLASGSTTQREAKDFHCRQSPGAPSGWLLWNRGVSTDPRLSREPRHLSWQPSQRSGSQAHLHLPWLCQKWKTLMLPWAKPALVAWGTCFSTRDLHKELRTVKFLIISEIVHKSKPRLKAWLWFVAECLLEFYCGPGGLQFYFHFFGVGFLDTFLDGNTGLISHFLSFFEA